MKKAVACMILAAFPALCLTSCTMGGNYVGLGNILNILFPHEGRDNAPVKWDTITIIVDRSSSISD